VAATVHSRLDAPKAEPFLAAAPNPAFMLCDHGRLETLMVRCLS
jgi:hypothetical protein